MNAADLAVFDAFFGGVAEEMGEALVRAATSVNIKERRDLSCAIFDGTGRLVANAPHMMGPGRPNYQRSDKLTPDHKTLLEGFNKSGIELTEKDIKEALSRENTLDAWTPKGAQQ